MNLTPHLPQEDGLLLLAHLDTLGGMVTRITGDGRSPYDYSLTSQLIAAAQKSGADYAVDILTNYGSDADATLTAGSQSTDSWEQLLRRGEALESRSTI